VRSAAGSISRRRSALSKSAPWRWRHLLKTALVQSAWAASHKKESHLRAQYYRLIARLRNLGLEIEIKSAAGPPPPLW
jgi:hypothetical protein